MCHQELARPLHLQMTECVGRTADEQQHQSGAEEEE